MTCKCFILTKFQLFYKIISDNEIISFYSHNSLSALYLKCSGCSIRKEFKLISIITATLTSVTISLKLSMEGESDCNHFWKERSIIWRFQEMFLKKQEPLCSHYLKKHVKIMLLDVYPKELLVKSSIVWMFILSLHVPSWLFQLIQQQSFYFYYPVNGLILYVWN